MRSVLTGFGRVSGFAGISSFCRMVFVAGDGVTMLSDRGCSVSTGSDKASGSWALSVFIALSRIPASVAGGALSVVRSAFSVATVTFSASSEGSASSIRGFFEAQPITKTVADVSSTGVRRYRHRLTIFLCITKLNPKSNLLSRFHKHYMIKQIIIKNQF